MAEEVQTIFVGDEISQLEELKLKCKIKQFLRNDFDWFRDKVEELEARSSEDKAVSVIRFFGNCDYEFVIEAIINGGYIDFRIYNEKDRRCLRFFVNRMTGTLFKVFIREAYVTGAVMALDLLIKPSWTNM